MVITEKRKAQMKAYYIKNAEKIKEYTKAYRQENAEKRKEYDKAYRQENAEKRKIKNKAWRKENPKKCKKAHTIGGWKHQGLICDDYDLLYEAYLKSTNCEECSCEYSEYGNGIGRFRCMDHDHTTGLFRNFLCNPCNLNRH